MANHFAKANWSKGNIPENLNITNPMEGNSRIVISFPSIVFLFQFRTAIFPRYCLIPLKTYTPSSAVLKRLRAAALFHRPPASEPRFLRRITMIVAAISKYGEVKDYIVDDVADIANLPPYGREKGNGGSTAFVINTSDVYILGSNGWRKI
jgi:hypothetical protein